MGKGRSNGRRCLVAGCGRQVRPGRAVCEQHRREAFGRQVEEGARRLSQQVEAAFVEGGEGVEAGERRRRAMAEFRRRLARGEYGELLAEPLRRVVAQAAAERHMEFEVGALRVAMAKLLTEEEDAARLALGVTRLAGATARALRAQQQLEIDEDPVPLWVRQLMGEEDEEGVPELPEQAGAIDRGWEEERWDGFGEREGGERPWLAMRPRSPALAEEE